MKLMCITGVIILLTRTNALYSGERCVDDNNRPGICRLLSTCSYLVNEITEAGTPMPSHIRRKLGILSCGFDFYQPLVCCVDTQIPETNTGNSNVFSYNETFTNKPTNLGFNGDFNRHGENDLESLSDIRQHPNYKLLPTNCGIIEDERIFGGNRTRLFEMPWMVLLSYASGPITHLNCGGTLINERYVLTAAHCVSFLESGVVLRNVILGEHDIRTDPDCEINDGELSCAPKVRNVSIDQVIAHPGYSLQKLADDIALIRLSERADLSSDSTKPICLPISRELQSEKLEGLNGVVAGWGFAEDGLKSPVLLSVTLPILTNSDCQEIFNGAPRIYDQQVCAGGVPGEDSCGGDSGGPLMYAGKTEAIGVRYVQRGIVSFGHRFCGFGRIPGVYTRVASYMKWILDNIRE